MPNIKSSAKRTQLGAVREAKNKSNRTYLRTTLKKFDAAVTAGAQEDAQVAYKTAVKAVDTSVSKGLLHKNNAARKKSSLTRRLNNMA